MATTRLFGAPGVSVDLDVDDATHEILRLRAVNATGQAVRVRVQQMNGTRTTTALIPANTTSEATVAIPGSRRFALTPMFNEDATPRGLYDGLDGLMSYPA